MSAYFPHVNLAALKKFATTAVAAEYQTSRKIKNAKKLMPQIVACEDIIWAGEKMIHLKFDKKSVPLGPLSVVAHFPKGRRSLTTQALVGMTGAVRACPSGISAPKIYAFRDILPNDVGAEVVLLEKVPGECLDEVWPTLSPHQEIKVCIALAELLLKLFNWRSEHIHTDLKSSGPEPPMYLLSRPFDHGPLALLPPQKALSTTTEYLAALCQRMDRLFDVPTAVIFARHSAHRDDPQLTDEEVKRIRVTWRRLAMLITHHTGGFYIPGTLSLEERRLAYTVLQSNDFGILHSDMQMSRFIINITPIDSLGGPTGSQDCNVSLTLTGWEHAHRAPLWSCARFPLFLVPRPLFQEPLSWEEQARIRSLIMSLIIESNHVPNSETWEWIVAHVFGFPERWFEGCLSSHWMYRDAIEVGLKRLKRYWEHWRPDIPFPLEVGGAFAGRHRE